MGLEPDAEPSLPAFKSSSKLGLTDTLKQDPQVSKELTLKQEACGSCLGTLAGVWVGREESCFVLMTEGCCPTVFHLGPEKHDLHHQEQI